MIKTLLSISLVALVSSHCFAQDIITKKNGEGVKAKVTEITPTVIKYKRFENLEGPTYTIDKTEVLLVKYENNTQEVFTGNESFIPGTAQAVTDVATASTMPAKETAAPVVNTATTYTTSALSASDLYNKGQQDALTHYKGYKGAGTGVLIGSLVSPLLGLIPAIACSSTQPQEHNLNYPDQSLMKDANYHTGYTNKARKIKSGKVWRNWGIAFGVNLAIVLALQN